MDWEAEGLLEGCAGDAARWARRALLDKLHDDGVGLDELRRAVAEDRLALLPVERLLAADVLATRPGTSRRRPAWDSTLPGSSAARSGSRCVGRTSRCTASGTSSRARMGHQYRQAGFPDEEALEAQRVLGRGMARYTEALTTMVGQAVLEPGIDEHELAGRLEKVSRCSSRSPAHGWSTSSASTCARRCARR